jgi:FKBP-type peptidyl-prolyl cis-trans isomerase
MRKTKSLQLLSTVAIASLSALLIAADAPTSQPAVGEKHTTASGLQIIEQGREELTAAAGDKVWVEYTGKLTDGTKFDSSADHPEQPFIFALGRHQVIAGWDEGIAGMKVGQKRQLIIPPNLAYGSQGVGNIPPNSTLVFDVKLLGVMKGQ